MERVLRQLKAKGVHIIESNYDILIEIFDHQHLSLTEVDLLITQLIREMNKSEFKRRVSFECPKSLILQLPKTVKMMKVRGERIIYKKEFSETQESLFKDYEVWPPFTSKTIEFLSKVMEVSKSKTENFLMSMKSELPNQFNQMVTVYIVNHQPIGIVLPHIEPGTDLEGRIFWIGIDSVHRNKGYGQNLHAIGLYRLQKDFLAKSYVGATTINNKAMRRIMEQNGCEEQKEPVISLEFVE